MWKRKSVKKGDIIKILVVVVVIFIKHYSNERILIW